MGYAEVDGSTPSRSNLTTILFFFLLGHGWIIWLLGFYDGNRLAEETDGLLCAS